MVVCVLGSPVGAGAIKGDNYKGTSKRWPR